MRCLFNGLVLTVLAATSVAAQTPPPGVAVGGTGSALVSLNFAGTVVGDFPSNLTMVDGVMDVVNVNGQHVLRATTRSAFLIRLPQVLPIDFTIEVDFIPKVDGAEPDLGLEGTPSINQGTASANILWHPTTLQVIGGAVDNFETQLPADFGVSTPGVMTRVTLIAQGPTIKVYTNGRLLSTLSNRKFVRGQVLRVFLGGQDDGPQAVYLASVRVLGGALPANVIAAGGNLLPSTLPGGTPNVPTGASAPQPPTSQPATQPPPGQPATQSPPTQPATQPPPTQPGTQPPPATALPAATPTGTASPTATAIPAAPPTGTTTPTSGTSTTGLPTNTGGAQRTSAATQPTSPGAQPMAQPAAPSSTNGAILVGTGISDITGPIAEVGMMGYGNGPSQGLHMRLYARAFVFASQSTGRRVAFVSAELGQLFSSIKQGVLHNLATWDNGQYRGIYDDRNVMISATHTHAGPGGYSHHTMYNLTTMGHVRQNYEAIVDGITEAIIQAHNRVAPATLGWVEGEVLPRQVSNGVIYPSLNRSKVAFDLNVEVAPTSPQSATATSRSTGPTYPNILPATPEDRRMVVLSIKRNGQPAGVIAWFAVHNTSLTNKNYLVSSDHKGYAAHLFEKQHGRLAPKMLGEFVAAFPNGAEGDQSPNTALGFVGPHAIVGGDEFTSNQIIGEMEFGAAHGLFQANQFPVLGDVDYKHSFVFMPGYSVTSTNYTNGVGGSTLCEAAYGASFMAGADDGPTEMRGKIVNEGMALGTGPGQVSQEQLNAIKAEFMAAVGLLMAPVPLAAPIVMTALAGVIGLTTDPCQHPKPVLLPTGRLKWTPETLPFQIFRMGPLAIVGIPGEMTVQAGRRLEAFLMARLSPSGIRRIILTGLANEYSGYITTPEEYGSQEYEGASTLFGRLTFDAYVEIFGQLADALSTGQNPRLTSPPPIPLPIQLELQTGVILDGLPPGDSFGKALVQPMLLIDKPGVVHAEFRAGHPKNNLKRNDTYIRIVRNPGATDEELVAWDALPETKIFWRNDGLATSRIIVIWSVPASAKPGTYQIQHFGSYKDGRGIHDYSGATVPFVVRAPTP